MKKLVLSLAIVSALGLSACGSETIKDVEENVTETATPIAGRVIFDPSAGVLSVPNDILMSGTLDGTLNIPMDDPTDTADPYFALNGLDGWSTANPFVIDIGFPEGSSLDGNTVFNPESVRIFEAEMGGGADECAAVPRGLACKVLSELKYTEDFITQKSGNAVAVIPLKPLKPKTSYILAMTNHLADDMGVAVAGSSSYELVRQDIATLPLGNESQLGLQAVINSLETAVVGAGVEKDKIIYTAAFTTQSTADVLVTNKALLAQNAQAYLASGGTQGSIPGIGMVDTGASVADIFASLGPANPIQNNPELIPLYSAANFLSGSVTLPYYLGIPSEANRMAPITDWWTSLCDSGAMLSGLAASNPGAIPEGPLSASDGVCMAVSAAAGLAAPGLRDLSSAFPVDVERHLTKFSPVAAPVMPSDIPGMNNPGVISVQMTTPDLAVASAVRAGMGLPALVKPDAGWPVVILQHGITSKKEDMLAITGILSVYGLATVAIDHPLHGSRGFDLTGDGIDEINASTVSATHYMNLASLLTTRDNLRQSTSDIIGLRFGLNFMQGFNADMTAPIDLEVDASNVHFLGHSLGAITGINFMALTNAPLDPAIDPMFNVSTSSMAMPGVMVANFLMESGAFGDVIKSQLTYAQSEDFQGYVVLVHAGDSAPTEAELIGYYREFYNNVLDDAQRAELNGIFAQFVFAAQTVTDSGDPINYAGMMAMAQKPTHLIEVVGGGIDEDMVNLPDQVIPNTVSSAPLGGTEGAIAFLGLPGVSETTGDTTMPVSGAVRYVFGSHSSILSPAYQAGVTASPATAGRATSEMQRQVADFFATGGKIITVNDVDVVY
jgi:Pla-1/cef family extracellular lipase